MRGHEFKSQLLFFIQISRGARCSSVVRAFAHGVMGRRIDTSWGGPIELFLAPASAPCSVVPNILYPKTDNKKNTRCFISIAGN